MSKIIILRGLPASGKSTRAQEILAEGGNYVRLNKDLLRTMLHFDKWNRQNENATWDAEVSLAIFFLTSGKNVVIDDTNLNPGTISKWRQLANKIESKLEFIDMHTSVEECIRRDAARQKSVGKHVIEKMALQYRNYLSGHKIVLCDLDGTLADVEHRRHFVNVPEGVPKDWKGFFGAMHLDPVREEVKSQIIDAHVMNNCKIVFVTARPEDYRQQTTDWLIQKVGLVEYVLIMRESGDTRADTEVKSDMYDKYLKNLTIEKVFDDRPSVIRMWKEKGLNVIDVGNGVEF